MKTENEKFPRLTERLRRQLPEGRVARLHEFATDLAIGFEEGAWTSTATFMEDRGILGYWDPIVVEENVKLLRVFQALRAKWPKEAVPDLDAMCSFGYFYRQSGPQYSLTEKALSLADTHNTSFAVFISYKRDKSSELALLFDSRIRYETNATPFVDHNLNPGDEWHAKLEEKIANSDAFICLIAPGTLCSPFVQKEINWALNDYEEKNRLIIPVWHKSYVSEENSKCDKISDRFEAVRVLEESAKSYDSAVDEVLNRLGYSTAFLEQRRR